jgi:hypothetical protein
MSEIDVDATKPVSDQKFYRLIRLKNGMRVLLIHDPTGSSGPDDDAEDASNDSGGPIDEVGFVAS